MPRALGTVERFAFRAFEWPGHREPGLVLGLGDERAPAGEEYPGKYFHPLVAGPITAGTRSLLAMMERMIRDAGGTWALMDTDSVRIVATKDGGPVPCPDGPHKPGNGQQAIRALSFNQAEAIRARFDALAPSGGQFWKVEKENAPHPAATRDPQLKTLVLGTKRYVLFNDGDRG